MWRDRKVERMKEIEALQVCASRPSSQWASQPHVPCADIGCFARELLVHTRQRSAISMSALAGPCMPGAFKISQSQSWRGWASRSHVCKTSDKSGSRRWKALCRICAVSVMSWERMLSPWQLRHTPHSCACTSACPFSSCFYATMTTLKMLAQIFSCDTLRCDLTGA